MAILGDVDHAHVTDGWLSQILDFWIAFAAMRPKPVVLCPPCGPGEEPGCYTTKNEISVLSGSASVWGRPLEDIEPRHLRRFGVGRVVESADEAQREAVVPLLDALLSRRLQTEEACVFNLGDAAAAEPVLTAGCVQHMLRGLAASPRILVASAVAIVHSADVAGGREALVDLLQAIASDRRPGGGATPPSETQLVDEDSSCALLLGALRARPQGSTVVVRLAARLPASPSATTAQQSAAAPPAAAAAGAAGAEPRFHLVLFPRTECLSSGPAAVSFGYLASAIGARGGGAGSCAPPPRSSKLLMQLRDVVRPLPAPAAAAGNGRLGSAPAQLLCLASVRRGHASSAHAIATLKLAARLCEPDPHSIHGAHAGGQAVGGGRRSAPALAALAAAVGEDATREDLLSAEPEAADGGRQRARQRVEAAASAAALPSAGELELDPDAVAQMLSRAQGAPRPTSAAAAVPAANVAARAPRSAFSPTTSQASAAVSSQASAAVSSPAGSPHLPSPPLDPPPEVPIEFSERFELELRSASVAEREVVLVARENEARASAASRAAATEATEAALAAREAQLAARETTLERREEALHLSSKLAGETEQRRRRDAEADAASARATAAQAEEALAAREAEVAAREAEVASATVAALKAREQIVGIREGLQARELQLSRREAAAESARRGAEASEQMAQAGGAEALATLAAEAEAVAKAKVALERERDQMRVEQSELRADQDALLRARDAHRAQEEALAVARVTQLKTSAAYGSSKVAEAVATEETLATAREMLRREREAFEAVRRPEPALTGARPSPDLGPRPQP